MSEKSKTVKMDAQNNKKLSYEQLEQLANNLNRQCQQFNEVDMLLSILEKSEHFNEDFVTRCANKVEEIITKALDSAEKQDEKTKE